MLKGLKVYNHTDSYVNKKKIHDIVKKILDNCNLRINSLEINFLNSGQIEEINSKYLNHNYSTDIITFNYSDEKSKLDGEIFISIEDAKNNAKKFKVFFENEIVRLIIHGILHMIGYDDTEPELKRRMKRKENEMVKKIWNNSFKGLVKL